jgi:hypothetical protein
MIHTNGNKQCTLVIQTSTTQWCIAVNDIMRSRKTCDVIALYIPKYFVMQAPLVGQMVVS